MEGDRLRYVSNLDNKIVEATIKMPCLVCADGEVNTPRLPSFKRKKEHGNCDDLIKIITFDDIIDKDETHYGLKGSPTQVERIFEPDKTKEKVIIAEGDLAEETFKILKDRKYI